MNYPETIKTINKRREFTLKERKSVFNAQIFPVSLQDDAESMIKMVRKKYYDASHHCYAFKLSDGTKRSSDAGEPSGSAGIRILNAIEHFYLSDVLIIVTRYFGGVKLGIGPLGKVYYNAAYNVINEEDIVNKNLFQKVKILCEYEYLSNIYRVLSYFETRIESTEYENKMEIECLLKPSDSPEIEAKLRRESGGNIEYNPIDEYLYL
jgi:uncharacterized YigZ family protein